MQAMPGAVTRTILHLSCAAALLAGPMTMASAQTTNEKKCIFAAAQKLPPIPGLSITASRVREVPKERQPEWKLERDRYIGFVSARKGLVGKRDPSLRDFDISMALTEIDVRAAAQNDTFEFVCFSMTGQPAVVYAINSR
jgi:hypothetical protein